VKPLVIIKPFKVAKNICPAGCPVEMETSGATNYIRTFSPFGEAGTSSSVSRSDVEMPDIEDTIMVQLGL